MSKKESMLFELMETCNFRDVFEHYSEAPGFFTVRETSGRPNRTYSCILE